MLIICDNHATSLVITRVYVIMVFQTKRQKVRFFEFCRPFDTVHEPTEMAAKLKNPDFLPFRLENHNYVHSNYPSLPDGYPGTRPEISGRVIVLPDPTRTRPSTTRTRPVPDFLRPDTSLVSICYYEFLYEMSKYELI